MTLFLTRSGDLPFILEQLVFYCVHERQPAGFDDVLADADGAPEVVRVGAFDNHADAGGSPSAELMTRTL